MVGPMGRSPGYVCIPMAVTSCTLMLEILRRLYVRGKPWHWQLDPRQLEVLLGPGRKITSAVVADAWRKRELVGVDATSAHWQRLLHPGYKTWVRSKEAHCSRRKKVGRMAREAGAPSVTKISKWTSEESHPHPVGQLLHSSLLGSLVLEPDLDHSHAQPSFFGQLFPYMSRWLRSLGKSCFQHLKLFCLDCSSRAATFSSCSFIGASVLLLPLLSFHNLWHALPILALLYLDLGQQGGAVHVVIRLNLR